ncbi:extracellular solute-binding protein [Legionella dresdenensis]|uniref:sn-glycerol-3-phosphate-binding periplasmic protein UgpB n=1 Tax=Legionella dresdenensis TaxID=450200 RepID=A0ABV8CC86_9GAMM
MKRFFLLLVLQCISALLWAKPVEIVMWHSLAGHLGDEINQLARQFNHEHAAYQIKLVYKGEYTDSITSFAAAFHAGKPPAIVQVYEVGTASMLSPAGIVKPVDDLMREQKLPLPEHDFLPALRSFYSKNDKLQALPFNTSIPVMYYNKAAFARAGIDHFPSNWNEMERAAAKLMKAGYSCAYTSAYPGWIQIESYSALNGLPVVTNQGKVAYNNQAVINHLQRLKAWQKKHYFQYGGRASDATVLFTSGHCPVFSQSSGAYKSLDGLVKFPLGVAAIPIDNTVTSTRSNNVIGGAALWVVAGQSEDVYRGTALFFQFIAHPDTQQHWHHQTGYLPLGTTGDYSRLQGEATLQLAQVDLTKEESNAISYAAVPQNQVRLINDEALEAVFAGIKSPAEAINQAAERANFAITRFYSNTSNIKPK